MDKLELLRRTGNLQQVASVRGVTFAEGRAAGLTGYTVKNGPLTFDVLADKCLDIGDLAYKGVNFSFLAKPGLNGRNPYDTHGAEALRSIMGGMLFTCGYETICAPCTIDGRDYPMHGRMRTSPAEHRAGDAAWKDGAYVLSVRGEVREAELFGENMLLRRVIETRLGEKRIVVRDIVENLAFAPQPLMLLYHFNVGHPLLSEAGRVVLPATKTVPRDPVSEPGLASWSAVEPPTDNLPEKVFIHTLAADAAGRSFAAFVNPALGLGVRLDFDVRALPYFMQWKSMASGDYAMGLEPANSSVYGKPHHHAAGDTHMLAAGASETFELVITILDGADELAAVETEARELAGA